MVSLSVGPPRRQSSRSGMATLGFPGAYEFRQGPGRYQTTPPWNGFVAQPGFRFAKPFVLEYPHQFRPSPPPPLRTRRTLVRCGKFRSTAPPTARAARTNRLRYAIWWMEFAEGSVNRLARQLSNDRRLHLWPAARMFAHIGMALYNTYVATWDAKYEYDHWRPLHGHSSGRHGQQRPHAARRDVGVAPSGAALSGVLVGSRGGLRRLV